MFTLFEAGFGLLCLKYGWFVLLKLVYYFVLKGDLLGNWVYFGQGELAYGHGDTIFNLTWGVSDSGGYSEQLSFGKGERMEILLMSGILLAIGI